MKLKVVNNRKMISLFLVMIILISIAFSSDGRNMAEVEAAGVKEHSVRALSSITDISYEESTDQIDNPYIGFYRPVFLELKRKGSKENKHHYNLTHIRCDLSDFSKSYNGESDAELTKDALDAFEATLKNLRKNHSTAIVRFAYHPKFDGDKTYEPSMKMILKHQEQLGKIISDYPDVVVTVECGLLGLWGEMHGSTMCTKDNFNKTIDKWLEVLPKDITVNVRTPKHFCDWSGADGKKLSSYVTKTKDKDYRVGIFNDGYLGSDSDLGTFSNRTEEINWLKNQAKHTLYGGEIVANKGTGKVKNTAAYMETEAFITHTSYLNIEWNNKVIDTMKKEDYSGQDEVYKGGTGFDYIRNHLGYRFVVRGVKLIKETTAYEDFGLEADIENVGFANLIRDKKLIVIFKGAKKTYQIPMTDKKVSAVTKWDSQKITTIKTKIDLPDGMKTGNYEVYIRLADDTDSSGLDGYPVRFANKDNEAGQAVWNTELGANFLGNAEIVSDTTIEKSIKKDNKTTFSIKNKSKIKKTAKIKIKDKDKIKKITLNGKKVKIKKNKKSVTIKLSANKKKLKKKGKWNKLTVIDKKGNKKTIKFKIG